MADQFRVVPQDAKRTAANRPQTDDSNIDLLLHVFLCSGPTHAFITAGYLTSLRSHRIWQYSASKRRKALKIQDGSADL